MRHLILGLVIALVVLPHASAAGQQWAPVGVDAGSRPRADSTTAEFSFLQTGMLRAPRPATGIDVVPPGDASEPWIGPQLLRHSLYGALVGALVGGAVGVVASNACKAGLCQDARVGVTLAASGITAFVGALVGFSLPDSDP